jgi:hypothetical protein
MGLDSRSAIIFENSGLVVTYPVTPLPHTGFRRGGEKPLRLTA